MNFDFPDDCKAMAIEVTRVLGRTCPMDEVRRCLETGTSSAPVWAALASLGVLGAAIPERWGGSGLGTLELCACAEPIGHACAPVPTLASVYLASEVILTAGSNEQRGRWLPLLASGKAVATAVLDSSGLQVARSGILTGRLSPVMHGATASLAVIHAAGTWWCVDLAQSGISRQPLRVLDPGLPLATLDLDGAHAQPMEGGACTLTDLRHRAAVLLAFEQLGGAERALQMARGHALARKTFGRTIGSYQAIKHKLADIWVRNQLARAHAYHGAWALRGNRSELALAAASARVSAAEAFEFAAQENLQVHGGVGFTWEADCHPLYKRARSTAVALEPLATWKARLLEQLKARRETEHGL